METRMTFTSLKDILDFAVAREEEAAAFYADLGRSTNEPALKMLLADLEKEEKKHKALLLGLPRKKAESLAAKPVTDLRITDYLLAEPPGPEMSFQDLLILGAKKEQKAVDLYTALRDRVRDAEHKKLFEFLIMQEKSHKLKLETEYERHVIPED